MTDYYEKRVNKLLDVYLDWLLSSDLDAGWHGDSVLQKMMEYGGDLPRGTGNDQSNVQMISEMRYLKNPHALFDESCAMLGAMAWKHSNAVLHARYFEGKINPLDGRKYTDMVIARMLRLTPRQYRHLKKLGYRKAKDYLAKKDVSDEADVVEIKRLMAG